MALNTLPQKDLFHDFATTLVNNVTYARYTKFEGLGRTYGIVLRNENFQAVRGPVWYTIAGTNYATHSHNLSTPSYVRYVQVLGNTSGSYNVIFDWVQLNYTPPTPTPSPTPTETPTPMPITATCPTTTDVDANVYAGPDSSSSLVDIYLNGTGIDLMGLYISGGWYAVRRYTPEGGAMGMRAAAIETEAIEGWIQTEDVVLTHEGGLPLLCLGDVPGVDGDGNIVEGTLTPTPTLTPTMTLSPTMTPTSTDVPCSSSAPADWEDSVVQIWIDDPNLGAYEVANGVYIGEGCFLTHSHWQTPRQTPQPSEFYAFPKNYQQSAYIQIDWSQVTYEFETEAEGEAQFCIDPSVQLPVLQTLTVVSDPRAFHARCEDTDHYIVYGGVDSLNQADPTQLKLGTIEVTGLFEDWQGFIDVDYGFTFDLNGDDVMRSGDSGSPVLLASHVIGIYAGGSQDSTDRAAWVNVP